MRRNQDAHLLTCYNIVKCAYLGGTAVWVYKILTGHLDCLIGFSKLDGIHQTLVPRLTVGIRHTHQVGGLRAGGGEGRKNSCHQQQKKDNTIHLIPPVQSDMYSSTFCTCPAASVSPHRAFEADPTQSPNAGTSPVLQF